MTGLTARQNELFQFIQTYMAAHDGVCPSLDEMATAVGFASKSCIHRMLAQIEARGHIKREKGKARALTIVRDAILIQPLPEIRTAIERYASEHGIAPATAVCEACRAYFVEAA